MVDVLWMSAVGCILMVCVKSRLEKKEGVYVICQRPVTESLRGAAILIIIVSHIVQDVAGNTYVLRGGILERIIGCWGGIGVSVFFFLSGYGNCVSYKGVRNKKQAVKRMFRQILKIVIVFSLTFVTVAIVTIISGKVGLTTQGPIAITETVKDYYSIRMPGTSTWYLKVQILFYVLLCLAYLMNPKYLSLPIFLGAIVWVISANALGLEDFWWKTSLCFPVGVSAAEYSGRINAYINTHKGLMAFASVCAIALAYVYVLKDGRFIVIPQLAAYTLISAAMVVLCGVIQFQNGFLAEIGRDSLVLYLAHIGLAPVLLRGESAVNLRVIIFMICTIVVSAAVVAMEYRIFNKRYHNK